MDKLSLEKVLGRKELQQLVSIENRLENLNERVLITGANGSIGTVLVEKFKRHNVNFLSTDIEGDHTKSQIITIPDSIMNKMDRMNLDLESTSLNKVKKFMEDAASVTIKF